MRNFTTYGTCFIRSHTIKFSIYYRFLFSKKKNYNNITDDDGKCIKLFISFYILIILITLILH